MFGKWLSRKDARDTTGKGPANPEAPRPREPRRARPDRRTGRPPAGADRDFVYDGQ
jgi:hypothetical protein